MAMANPPHPGLSVKHDCLEPLGLTVTDALLGGTRQTLNDLIHGRRGISPEMAAHAAYRRNRRRPGLLRSHE